MSYGEPASGRFSSTRKEPIAHDHLPTCALRLPVARRTRAAGIAVLLTAFTVVADRDARRPAPAEPQATRSSAGSTATPCVTSRGTVRLIGIDTPEVGKCGAKKATRIARRLAPVGSTVRLGNPSSVQNTDKYDR